jgi:hypothetical protein
MWSEQELEEEFGLLPGEEDERNKILEGDWWLEMEVEDRLIQEGRCLRDLEDGFYAHGIWRGLRGTMSQENWGRKALSESLADDLSSSISGAWRS